FLLMPGMYASAVLKLDPRNDALTVAIQAVSHGANKPTVWRVNAGKRIEERAGTLGIATGTNAGGLSRPPENDLVILGNRSQLKPGQLVEPKIVEAGGY